MQKTTNAALLRPSKDEYQQLEKLPIVVVLDNVRSMQNVGSIFRSCDAFGVSKILLCGITAKPPHRDIHKTALGATETVNWEYHDNTLQAIQDLQNNNFRVYCIEQAEPKVWLHEMEWNKSKPLALVFGNEVDGVNIEVMKQANGCIEIPQHGTKHSVNVSIAAGLVLWQFYQKYLL